MTKWMLNRLNTKPKYSSSESFEFAERIRRLMENDEGTKLVEDMMDADIDRLKEDDYEIPAPNSIRKDKMLHEITEAIATRKRRLWVMRVAAVLVPAMVLIGMWQIGQDDMQDMYRTVYVPAGEQLRLILADGTDVTLNAETTLEYPVKFGRKRHVKLKGEAFFDVAKHKRSSFEVETEAIRVKVLGTQFNVNTECKDRVTSVYLKEGSVDVVEKVSGNSSTYRIKPGQIASVSELNGVCRITADVEPNTVDGWLHKRYYFREASLADLTSFVERAYGVRFIVSDSELFKFRYTINFYNESVDEILNAMELITPIRCVRNNDTITIYSNAR